MTASTHRIDTTATAPAAAPQPETGVAVAAHLISLFTGWIGSLVFVTSTRNSSPFVRQHTRQAMNMQLNVLVFGLIVLVLSKVAAPLSLLGLFVIIGFPVLAIMAAVRASRADWSPYPRLIQFLPALPEPRPVD